jgi:hypothetical protein
MLLKIPRRRLDQNLSNSANRELLLLGKKVSPSVGDWVSRKSEVESRCRDAIYRVSTEQERTFTLNFFEL